MSKFLVCTAFLLTSLFCQDVLGQSSISSWEFPRLNIERVRNYLTPKLLYTHDYVSSIGGIKSGPRNIGALDFFVASDLSKYSRVKGDFMAHYIHINSNDTRAAIGDVQTTSNIDAPVKVDRVGDLWYQHHWSQNLKTLIGLHDISSEFNITESSLTFLNSSFGTSAELSYSGLNAPSVYPITSLGVRALYHISEDLSLRTAIYHANPGGVETYQSFHVDVGGKDGFLYLSELVFQTADQKIGIGGWNYTKSQINMTGNKSAPLYGFYGMWEEKFNHSLWFFARTGWATPVTNEVDLNLATGLVYRGIFQKKNNNDEAGLGVTNAHFSKGHVNNVRIDEQSTVSSNETAYEIYYNFKPLDKISLRPDIQFIQTPGGIKSYKNAWLVGIRTMIEL